MNNQFSGPNAWGDYLAALEQVTPVIEAIAVTDYYVTDTYEEVLRHKATGRLPSAKLVFPNVELRLDVATAKGGFVNLHLFVSPEDPQHLDELRRLLSRLQFNVMQDRFDCTRADLIRLGKKAEPNIADERAALAYGANQFKVNFQKLREVFSERGWAKKNILIAVAGGATDGTSGVREAADQTIRREIEGFAHVIFAGSPAQREFWLGQRDLGPDEIRTRYGGPEALPARERRAQARRRGVALRKSLLVDQRRARIRRAPPGVHRSRGARLCRRAAAGLGDAITGHLARPDRRCRLGHDARHPPQSWPRRHHQCARIGEDSPGRRDRGRLRRDFAVRLERR